MQHRLRRLIHTYSPLSSLVLSTSIRIRDTYSASLSTNASPSSLSAGRTPPSPVNNPSHLLQARTMPGLIQRYNVAAEYSEMLSTARQRSTSRRASLSSRHAAAGAASEWYHAVCPPLEDFQDVIHRFQRDPEFSQDRVFRFLRPLFVFSILFAVAVFALQPNSFAHHILTAPEEHTKDLAIYGAGILAVLLVGLAILRSLIWCVGEVAAAIVSLESRQERDRRNTQELPSSNVLLGGILL